MKCQLVEREIPVSAPAGALGSLLDYLSHSGYSFVTPTPATHGRVLARNSSRLAVSNEDVLGWNRPFLRGTIDPELEHLLNDAGMIAKEPGGPARARIRVANVYGRLFLHSAYPSVEEDAVFLGPDSYRFSDLIQRELRASAPAEKPVIMDIGTGAGVGAVMAADLCPGATIIGTDLNSRALALAQINVHAAGHEITTIHGAGIAGFQEPVDLCLANPPYMIDGAGRQYRDGGSMYGAEVSVAMAEAALSAMAPGGRLILYTGSAIVGGTDRLRAELVRLGELKGYALKYSELDPDVFGEELVMPGYESVDRIAVVAAIFRRGS